MKNLQVPSRNKGITLLELVSSFAIAMILVLIMAAMTDAGTKWSTQIQTDISANRDSKVALDYFGTDFSAIAPARANQSSFAIAPEFISGPVGINASSFWIMMLSRPASQDKSGALRTISYRIVYTDPMTPSGNYPRYALYRSVVTPKSGGDNTFLKTTNLHTEYWAKHWPRYKSENSGYTLLDDYLLENIVDIKTTLNYTYLNKSNVRESGSKTPLTPVSWSTQGFTGGGIPPEHIPNTPISLTLKLTVLSATGTESLNSGGKLSDLIEREGITVGRTFPITTR